MSNGKTVALFGRRVSTLRQRRSLDIPTLAELLRLKVGTVWYWEHSITFPQPSMVLRLEEILDAPLAYLLFGAAPIEQEQYEWELQIIKVQQQLIPNSPVGGRNGLPDRLCAMRIVFDLSEKEIAARLGVSIPTWRRWESGGRSMPPPFGYKLWNKIARTFGVSAGFVVSGTDAKRARDLPPDRELLIPPPIPRSIPMKYGSIANRGLEVQRERKPVDTRRASLAPARKPKPLFQTIGNRIREAREALEEPASEIVQRLNLQRPGTYFAWEEDSEMPSLAEIEQVASALHARPEYLAFGRRQRNFDQEQRQRKIGITKALRGVEHIGDRIREARKYKRWAPQMAAVKCITSLETYAFWETGVKVPDIEETISIAKAFEVSPGWIAFGA